MARACHYAEVHNGGVLEPLYQLHATRLKMLTSASPPLSDISRCVFGVCLAQIGPGLCALASSICFCEEHDLSLSLLAVSTTNLHHPLDVPFYC
jgi:hypothetical protein